jgi:MSHA biogenesis protein MshJ
MKARWQQWETRFAAISRRERIMLAVAALAAVVFLGNLLWLGPSVERRGAASKALAQKEAEVGTLRAQIAQLKQQAELERVQGEAALKELHSEYRRVETQLGELGRNLIAAREMPGFLRSVMPPTRALEIVAVRTLAVSPLLPPREGAAAKPVATAGQHHPDEDNLYRHSVEIQLAGRYGDLYDWLRALERAPKKVLWGDLRLEVRKYPFSVLTLTVHTLSLDRAWLSI